MTFLVALLFSPALLLITIPLAIFAALTSIFAFSTLLLRALIVYAEMAGVLIQNQFINYNLSTQALKSAPSKAVSPRKPRSERRRSGSSNGSTTPRTLELSGLGAYGSGNPVRDFEGLGGWRMPGSPDEDVLWTQMNSRLELPAFADGRQRNHHRSRTSSSLMGRPLLSHSPTQSRTATPNRGPMGRPSSPEEYFANRRPSKSTTSLDTANIGRTLLRHRNSSSSGSSQGSIRLSSLVGPDQ